jgi:hypothetical protein
MNHTAAFLSVPVPAKMAKLPRDRRGYPIPDSAFIRPDGTPDFTTVDHAKWITAAKFRRCGICGNTMHGRVWFVGGPACEANRLFFDHPMHEECAKYALQVCPFLALPVMHYRKKQEEVIGFIKQPVHSMSDVKPDRFMLGKCHKYDVVQFGPDLLLRASEWEELTWWVEGKQQEK